jgi:ribosomal-protein-alanine N-acetyltransferase
MAEMPTIETERLILRPYRPSDAADVQRLAGAREVAYTTLNIPYPYPDGAAETWIGTHAAGWAAGEELPLAVTLRDEGRFVGGIGLSFNVRHEWAEMGYWIAVADWGKGYCTEAARALLGYGFETLGLNRIQATHLKRNPASGRVMQKIGMQCEGCLRQGVKKWNQFEDLVQYAILRDEYFAGRPR